MSYFKEVYQKRLTKNGATRQDIAKTHKEHEFDLIFMKRTIYLANVYKVNGEKVNFDVSLQPNKWNESNLISNLLMSTSLKPFKTGDLISIKMTVKKEVQDKTWLVLFVDDNITKGYQNFKVICLDSDLNITDEYGNSIYSAPAKIINASQSIVQDTIITSVREKGYREPKSNRILITQQTDEIKKGVYFNYGEKGWEIVGDDLLSIPNVAYIFVSERLIEEPEPISSEEILVGEDTNFFLNGR